MARKKKPSKRSSTFKPMLEALERRWLPACGVLDIALGPTICSFIDADGDEITARIEGTAGTVIFDDGTGDDVDDGENIATITILGASKDFVLSLSVDSSGAGADGVVIMGDITADTRFGGIFTVPDITSGPVSNFELGSFTGPGFSHHGGLSVDSVVGNAAGLGIEIDGSLGDGRVINVRGTFDADLLIRGDLGGVINAQEVEDGGNLWRIRGSVLEGAVISTGEDTGDADFDADVLVDGNFAGIAQIGDDATGTWTIEGKVTSSARFSAAEWSDIVVEGNFNGRVITTSDDLTLTVGGNVGSQALAASAEDLTVTVGGSVRDKATFTADSDVTLDVDGSFEGIVSAVDDITMAVGGNMINGVLGAGDDITLGVVGNMINSRVSADSAITLGVVGSIVDSVVAAGDEDLEIGVVGNVVRSQLTSGQGITGAILGDVRKSALQGSEDDVEVDIGGDLVRSRVTCGSEEVTLAVEGDIVKSSVTSLESSVTVTVGGDLVKSAVAAETPVSVAVTGDMVKSTVFGTDVSLIVGGDMVDSVATATDGATVFIGGSMVDSAITAADEITLTVAGAATMKRSTVITQGNITADIAGGMVKSQITSTGGDVTLSVDGSMDRSDVHAATKAFVDISGNMVKSNVFGDGDDTEDLTLFVFGDMIDSTAMCGDTNITAFIAGDMIRSQLLAPESVVTAFVGGDMFKSTISAGDGISATIDGDMIRSNLFAGENDITLDVGGSVILSEILAPDGAVTADITFDFLQSTIVAEDDSTISIGGDVGSTISQTDDDLTLEIGGSLQSGGKIAVTGGALLALIGRVNGSIQTDDLDLIVENDVGPSGTIQAESVFDLNGDDIGFEVGADFLGTLAVSESFDTGLAGTAATLVFGDVGRGAKFNIVKNFGEGGGADTFSFAGDFNGELNLDDDLEIDLAFGGDVHRITIGGSVEADITVAGFLDFLSSGSLFVPTVPGFDGDFEDGVGTVTGTLDTTGGFGTVTPLA